jgi:hypothetical protein
MYLAPSFNLVDRDYFNRIVESRPHSKKSFGETELEFGEVHVKNAPDVELSDHNTVYVDNFGRVNAFIMAGEYYVIAES